MSHPDHPQHDGEAIEQWRARRAKARAEMSDQAAAFGAGFYPGHPMYTSVDAAIGAAINAGSGDEVTVGEMLDVLAIRSVGPLLFVPALIAVLPIIGALPGVSWTTAGLVLLLSIQLVFTRNSHWAPEALRTVKIRRSVLVKSLSWARPASRWIDRVTKPRLMFLVRGPAARLIGLSVFVMSIVMFILSVVPGGVVAPAFVVLVLAVALTTQDGAIALIGHTLALGSVALAWWLLHSRL